MIKKSDLVAVNGDLEIKNVRYFDPDLIFDCGQCFRFEKYGNVWKGIALGEELALEKDGDTVRIFNCDEKKFREKWEFYLGLADDYDAIRSSFPAEDCYLRDAMEAGKGIRILHQDGFEVLISFIISQNNNIARIKKCISRVCERYGKRTDAGYLFPDPETLACAEREELKELGLGYRDEYIPAISRAVLSGEFSFDYIEKNDGNAVLKYLAGFKGIGPKVASCVALFGFGKFDAFPVDVWIKRILDGHYPGMKDGRYFGKYAGIAQQYMFYYERWKNSGNDGGKK